MSEEILPIVETVEDYIAIQEMAPDDSELPRTFNEWKRKEGVERAKPLDGHDHRVEVPISADELQQTCLELQVEPSFMALRMSAIKKNHSRVIGI